MEEVKLTASIKAWGPGFAVLQLVPNQSINKRQGMAAFNLKMQQCQLDEDARQRLSSQYRRQLARRLLGVARRG